jgi:hypothetical protein
MGSGSSKAKKSAKVEPKKQERLSVESVDEEAVNALSKDLPITDTAAAKAKEAEANTLITAEPTKRANDLPEIRLSTSGKEKETDPVVPSTTIAATTPAPSPPAVPKPDADEDGIYDDDDGGDSGTEEMMAAGSGSPRPYSGVDFSKVRAT